MVKQLSNKGKLLVFLYFFISFSLVTYFSFPKFPYIEFISVSFASVSGIIFNLIIMKSDKLKTWYEKLMKFLNKDVTNKVESDLKQISKIKDKNLRNLMVKSYIDTVFENTRSDIGTKIIMIINLIVISLNLVFLLITSFISNTNPLFMLLIGEKIKEFGAANVSQQFGINYNNLPTEYINFTKQYSYFFTILPMAFIISFFIIFFGSMLYFLTDSARKTRLKIINETLVKLNSKNK